MLWWWVGLTAWCIRDKQPQPLFDNISFWNAYVMYLSPVEQMLLLPTSDWYRHWNATDPRDRVYGILGLVPPESGVEALKLDYDEPASQVYADVALSEIRLYSHLKFFTYVIHPGVYDKFHSGASWVPDWSPDLNKERPMYEQERMSSLSASKKRGVRETSEDHISATRLRLRGSSYHAVVATHEPITREYLPGQDSFGDLSGLLKSLSDWGGIPALVLGANNPGDWRTLAMTLTAGWMNDITHPLDPEIFYPRIGEMLQDLLHSSGERATAQFADRTFASHLSRAFLCCRDRRIFRLENSTCGLGPQYMRPGDIVAVLFGGFWPVVLRPVGDQYLFMGIAYVHELMYVKLVDEVEAGEREEQEFCLV
ncbi:hypothetical protein CC86DRAFT_295367 [Ophiobolus disseminans]|uniref:Heterokaryon incompatibility domain-containing protein n=1 Tax=Ophiobolus disseminans TaxID=1469910 RepID=A0A6A6ZYS3_9PLEO|nr:hypothetical protein CC86DRAFT_295367 [Ophiobolus disseminans]